MKTKTKFYALLLALALFLLSLFSLGGALRAYAYENDPYAEYVFPDYVPDSEYVPNPDESLTSLYYFSDYEGSENYYENGFVRDYMDMNPYITNSELYYWGQYLCDTFMLYFTNNGPHDFENAFIIFEVRYTLPWELGVYTSEMFEDEKHALYESSFYWYLEQAFSYWKDHNCKIMFISGTDDVWYETYLDGFLDYVDIHINVDLKTTFTYSTVCDIYETCGLEGSVMIFDSFTSSDGYFREFFLPYVIYVLYEDGKTLNINPPVEKFEDYKNIFVTESIVNALGLTVYFYDNGTGSYTDIYGDYVDEEEARENFKQGGFSCIVAGTQSFDDANLLELCEENNRAQFYLYNDLWKSLGEIPEDLKYFGMSAGSLNYYLSVIMRDFILNDRTSLQQYDDWEGRCEVTFKPVFRGEGWARNPEGFEVIIL